MVVNLVCFYTSILYTKLWLIVNNKWLQLCAISHLDLNLLHFSLNSGDRLQLYGSLFPCP
jgi:hypothetical protein